MEDKIQLALIFAVVVFQLIHTYRQRTCMEINEVKEREIIRKAIEGFKCGHDAGMEAARRATNKEN